MFVMKRLLMSVAVLAICTTAFAQEKNFIDQNYMEVTGRADLEVVPDEIYLRINISEKENKGKVSVEQQQKEMFRKLKDLNIDIEKNLVVQDQSADLRTYLLRKNTVLSTKTYLLKVSTATQVGQVFRALADIGVSDVNIEKTDVSNMDELRQQVRAAAAVAAKQNAEILAQAVGRQAGKALYIQDYSYNARPYANVMLAKSSAVMDAAGEESMPELEFEKIKIEHSVMIRFALE